ANGSTCSTSARSSPAAPRRKSRPTPRSKPPTSGLRERSWRLCGRVAPAKMPSTAHHTVTERMTSPAALARKPSLSSSAPGRADAVRHHRVHGGASGPDDADETLEVAPHLARAVHAAEQLLLVVEQLEAGQRDLGVEAGHADDDGGAASPGHAVGLHDRVRQT